MDQKVIGNMVRTGTSPKISILSSSWICFSGFCAFGVFSATTGLTEGVVGVAGVSASFFFFLFDP